MDKTNPEVKKKAVPKKPATFLTIDNSNILGWIMSCFIVCGCMFFLGVLVGRNTAPIQFDVDRIEERLANLQVSVLHQNETEPAENPIPLAVAEPELPVVAEDIIDKLKDKGKPPEIYEQYVPPVFTPKYPKTRPKKTEPDPAEQTEVPEPASQTPRTESVAVLKPEIQPAPAEISAPVVKPDSLTAEKSAPPANPEQPNVMETETGGHKFAIQVASLRDPAKAQMLMNKFTEKGYPAFCQSSDVNGTMWHRVRIGPYPERALAAKDQERLKAAGVDTLLISMN